MLGYLSLLFFVWLQFRFHIAASSTRQTVEHRFSFANVEILFECANKSRKIFAEQKEFRKELYLKES